MSRIPSPRKLTLSVLDRLTDDRPDEAQEVGLDRPKSLNQIKDAVKRDLEWLLNSKQALATADAESSELKQSLLTYGLPDFTTATLNSVRDQSMINRAIEEAIRIFEPRLTEVRVHIEPGREHDRTLRFRIEAKLRVDPVPIPVAFDSVLQLGTRAFQISEG